MKAIILCGGLGTRVNSHKTGIPKALIKINKKPILTYILEHLWENEIYDIRLALGFGAEKIIEFLNKNKIDVEYVIEEKKLDTGGASKFASIDIDDDFLVINGDIISNVELKEFIRYHNKDKNTIKILAHFIKDARDFGLLKTKGEYVIDFLEKPKKKKKGLINAGFYIMNKKVFEFVKKDVFSLEKDLFPKLAKRRMIKFFEHTGFWIDVGTPKRISFAKNILKQRNFII